MQISDGSGWQMSGSGRVRVLKFFSGSGRVGFWNSSSGFLLHYFSKISGFFGFSGRVCTFSGSGRVRASKKPSGRVGFSGFRVPDPSLPYLWFTICILVYLSYGRKHKIIKQKNHITITKINVHIAKKNLKKQSLESNNTTLDLNYRIRANKRPLLIKPPLLWNSNKPPLFWAKSPLFEAFWGIFGQKLQ